MSRPAKPLFLAAVDAPQFRQLICTCRKNLVALRARRFFCHPGHHDRVDECGHTVGFGHGQSLFDKRPYLLALPQTKLHRGRRDRGALAYRFLTGKLALHESKTTPSQGSSAVPLERTAEGGHTTSGPRDTGLAHPSNTLVFEYHGPHLVTLKLLGVFVFPPSQLVVVARQLYQVRLKLPYLLLGEAALDVLHRPQHLPSDVSVGPLERWTPHGRRAAGIDGEGGPLSLRVLYDVPPVEEGGTVREVDAPSGGEGYPEGENEKGRLLSR